MSDRGRHPAHLPVSSFVKFNRDPHIRNRLSHTNRRITRWHQRLRLQPPCARRKRKPALNHHATGQLLQRRDIRLALHLRPIPPPMPALGIQQAVIQSSLIREQQQSLGVRVEPSDGINLRRQAEFRERPLAGRLLRELAQHAVGLVENEQHPLLIPRHPPRVSI